MLANEPSVVLDAAESSLLNLEVHGYTIIPDALSSEVLRTCREAFDALLTPLLKNPETTFPFGNCRLDLPLEPPFVEDQILANSKVVPLLDSILGNDAKLEYFASNTSMPGSEYQRVHSDNASLFPEHQGTLPPHALVVNFPLVDFTLENGPLEIWPGTHRIPEHLRSSAVIETTAAKSDPLPVLLPAGSAIVRDIRMWHRGTPNHTRTPRPMLALVYFRPWYDATPRLTISRPIFDRLSARAQGFLRREEIVG